MIESEFIHWRDDTTGLDCLAYRSTPKRFYLSGGVDITKQHPLFGDVSREFYDWLGTLDHNASAYDFSRWRWRKLGTDFYRRFHIRLDDQGPQNDWSLEFARQETIKLAQAIHAKTADLQRVHEIRRLSHE